MRKSLICFLVLFYFKPAFTQQFTLSTNTYTQTAYVGINNQISCTVEGVNSKIIVLSTSNGEIIKEEGQFIYRPLKTGDSKISVHLEKNGKLKKVGERVIMVREFPKPRITIGGSTEKEISKSALLAQNGIGCHYVIPGLGFDFTCSIDSFSVTALRDSSALFHVKCKGNKFSEELIELLRKTKEGDIILVSGIIYKSPDQTGKKGDPIEYIIK
ncbi:MAG TPA: GldM family protein [Chitinophagaceae bacterium]